MATLDYCAIAEQNYNDLLAKARNETTAAKLLAAIREAAEVEARKQHTLRVLDKLSMSISEMANEAYIADRPVRAAALADAYQILFEAMVELSQRAKTAVEEVA